MLPVDGYHIAAAFPDLCADIVASFIGGSSPTELAQMAEPAS